MKFTLSLFLQKTEESNATISNIIHLIGGQPKKKKKKTKLAQHSISHLEQILIQDPTIKIEPHQLVQQITRTMSNIITSTTI